MTTDTRIDIALSEVELSQRRWIKWHLYLGFVGLLIGTLMGVLQALERLDVNLYDEVGLESYYQGLTLHGVTMALVFTFAFANAFLSLTVIRGFGRPLASHALLVGSFVTAAAGVVMAAIAMLLNQATVLYTLYAPLQATPLFYIGAVLLVISTWMTSVNQLLTLKAWRKKHPGERIPLLSYISIMTFLMWDIASVGLAVSVLGFLLPWAFGWVGGTDPLFTRTLFWFTGHPIVYFWLLPVYVSWYMMAPARASGKLFSDGVVRGVFILFLLLSTPVGLHHQFTDPGVHAHLKFIHGLLTLGVFFPSMVTAFTLVAAFENGGKRRGGKGLIGWIPKLPWGDAIWTGQVLAMLGFTLGGATGLINASYTVNVVVHNTAFIPGHFHLTVGTATALSIMAISYWMVPHLTGRRLFSNRLALAQVWMWFGGVLMFSRGLMAAGIDNQPRRIPVNSAPYAQDSWTSYEVLTGIGGIIMTISAFLFFYIIIRTAMNKVAATSDEMSFEISETIKGAEESPAILDRLGLWFVAAVALVLLAYVPVLLSQGLNLDSPGFILF
ncbi:cbb3-type cytochrome c oxidase subunit I [bacterium]|nr:cbb3-type cytochrome c oxidase subunit I [bacterium]